MIGEWKDEKMGIWENVWSEEALNQVSKGLSVFQ
jgi:hypothetical protein